MLVEVVNVGEKVTTAGIPVFLVNAEIHSDGYA